MQEPPYEPEPDFDPSNAAREVRRVTDFALRLPDEALEQVAQRPAEIVLASMSAAAPESPFMSAREAASYLRCGRQRVDDLLSQRRLTRFKEGGRTLVSRSEVEALAVAQVLPLTASRGSVRVGAVAPVQRGDNAPG